MSNEINFFKYTAAGNDFILVEADDNLSFSQEQIVHLCHRTKGVGSDGLLLFKPLDQNFDYEMIFFNPDGSSAEMCGNGARAMLHFAHGYFKRSGKFNFIVGDKHYLGNVDDTYQINMGKVKSTDIDFADLVLDGTDCVALNSGVPHAIIAQADIYSGEFIKQAEKIRWDKRFVSGTNVDVINYDKVSHSIEARVFERGVEGETESSGTGATACAAAASIFYSFSPNWKVDVKMKGGTLHIFEDSKKDIWMSGPIKQSYRGIISL